MTINIFVLKGDLNGKIVVVRFFFCWVYISVDLVHHEIKFRVEVGKGGINVCSIQ